MNEIVTVSANKQGYFEDQVNGSLNDVNWMNESKAAKAQYRAWRKI